jgi:hypothetical protein
LWFDAFKALIPKVFPDHTRRVEDRIVITFESDDGSPAPSAVIAVADEQRSPTIRGSSDGRT